MTEKNVTFKTSQTPGMLHIPQLGCEPCRTSRKICDRQRLRCSECVANSLACVGQRDQVNLTFVDDNHVAAVASRRAAGRRSRDARKRKPVALDISLLERSANVPTDLQPQAQLVAPILYNLDDRVIRRFFSRWEARQTSLGCLDAIPYLFEASGRNSAMQKAILATAYADLTVFERDGNRGMQAHQAYLTTLRRLQTELSNPSFEANDSILAAVLTIDAFELLYMGRAEALGIHTQAISRLLELRKGVGDAQERSYTLWRSANQHIYVRQIFCEFPSIGLATFRGSNNEIDNHPEVRTVKFVAASCTALSQIKHERERPIVDREKIARICTVLRDLMRISLEDNATVAPARRVLFHVAEDPELHAAFPSNSADVYDNLTIARDRLLFNICCIRILDVLLELHTEDFSSRRFDENDQVEAARDFLLVTQPDLHPLQQKCRLVLDVVPLLLGLVLPNGTMRVEPWILNDTGVLTVKSPLKTIANLKYGAWNVKTEANAVLTFLDRHRHVIHRS